MATCSCSEYIHGCLFHGDQTAGSSAFQGGPQQLLPSLSALDCDNLHLSNWEAKVLGLCGAGVNRKVAQPSVV